MYHPVLWELDKVPLEEYLIKVSNVLVYMERLRNMYETRNQWYKKSLHVSKMSHLCMLQMYYFLHIGFFRVVAALKQFGGGGGAGQGLEKMSATMVDRQRKCYVLNDKWHINFCHFSETFLNMLRIFIVRQNYFCETFSFYKGFFIKIPKYLC